MMKVTWVGFLVMLAAFVVPAQTGANEKCPGPVYGGDQVSRPAKIVAGPDLRIVTER